MRERLHGRKARIRVERVRVCMLRAYPAPIGAPPTIGRFFCVLCGCGNQDKSNRRSSSVLAPPVQAVRVEAWPPTAPHDKHQRMTHTHTHTHTHTQTHTHTERERESNATQSTYDVRMTRQIGRRRRLERKNFGLVRENKSESTSSERTDKRRQRDHRL
jgi:hypothetical protein